MIVNRKSIFLYRILSDLVLLNIAFLAAAVLAQPLEILLERNYMFFLLIGLNLLWIISSNATGFYDDFYSRNFSIQFINILKSAALQLIITITFIFLTKEDLFTRYFIVYFFFLIILLISLRVVAFRKILKYLRKHGKNIRNLLIIGTDEIADKFKKMVESNPDFGYRLIGTVSSTKNEPAPETTLGDIENLANILSEHKVDEVVVTTVEDNNILQQIINICNRLAVKIHIIPDYFKYVTSRLQISTFGEFPIVTVRREPLEEAQKRFVKRLFDIVFSLMVIIFVLSWLYPIIFIMAKLTSPGPFMFIQERIGAKNQKFRCYKFRTLNNMKTDPVSTFSPVVQNDPRVTKLGRFLRRSNLDELPQFVNVLLGDMSVVGPRPHAIPYDEKYGSIVEEIKLRHNVKPGITGWAQIHGLRGDVPDEEKNKKRTKQRIEYDLWYIENWSFTLDIQIILLTIWQMIRGKTRAI